MPTAPARASLPPGSAPSYATDGDPATFTQATQQYRWQLVVDLQQAQSLGYVTVSVPQRAFATAFHVDASIDGSNWTTDGTVTDADWGTIPVSFSTPVSARSLRIVADKPDNGGQRGGQMAISQVGAYAAPVGANLALNKPAQALYIDGTQTLMQPGSTPGLAHSGNQGLAEEGASPRSARDEDFDPSGPWRPVGVPTEATLLNKAKLLLSCRMLTAWSS